MDARYRLRLLGPVEAECNSVPVKGFVSRKAVAMLGYLTMRGQSTSRSHLADLFWQDKAEARGRANLSRALNNLTVLLPNCWQADYHSIRFQPPSTCWLDTHTFAELVAQNEIAALNAAVELYRGEFMADICLDDCPEFDVWLEAERTRWREQIIQVLQKLIHHHNDHHEYEQSLHFVSRWLEIARWEEEAHQQIMLLLARTGRRSAALAQYETCRHLLVEELGVEPSPKIITLYERIRMMPTGSPHNLPAQPTPFVGREVELAQLAALLRNPTCRLISLVGPGGTGKTRLALEAARQVTLDSFISFLNGVYLVSLAGVSTVEALPGAMAEVLELSLYGATDPKLQLLRHLKNRELLLVLDNFEQLLPEGTALLVDILQHAPGVKLLITSRAYLGLRWEWRFPVPGLPVPDMTTQPDLAETSSDAVQVFLNIARRVYLPFSLSPSNYSAVVCICQLLEGLPLGIELAASWVHEHTSVTIAQEIERNLDFLTTSLHDVPARHRSLRAVFNYSWGLLLAEEQRVLSRLSVFRGGFQLEAAAQIAGAARSILTSLLNKSLLRRAVSGRFEMHELLKQYAAEKLADMPGEPNISQARHWAYFAEFLQRDLRHGGSQKEALVEINREIDNIRVGWSWAIERGNIEEISNGVHSLWSFYEVHGWFQEGEAVFRAAAEALEKRADLVTTVETDTTAYRGQNYVIGQMLNRQGWFFMRLGQNEKALNRTLQALSLLDHAKWEDQPEIGIAFNQLGYLTWLTGDYKKAKSFFQKSLTIGRTIGDQWLMLTSCQCLGLIAQAEGHYAEARQWFLEAYENGQQGNDRFGMLAQLICLGNATYLLGEYTEAKKLLANGLAMAREMDYRFVVALGLHHLGALAYLVTEYVEAKQLLQESYKIFEEMDERRFAAVSLTYLGYVACALGEDQEAGQFFYTALKLAHDAQANAVTLAVLAGIATLLTSEGKKEQALELFFLIMHHPASEHETKDRIASLLAELTAGLPSQVVALAQVKGESCNLTEVVTEILEHL